MKKVIILGAGGNCIDILDAMFELNRRAGKTEFECAGFLDDDQKKWGAEIAGVRILGGLERALEYPDCEFINGIGSPANYRAKKEIIAKTGVLPDRFVNIIHPSACVSRMASLGRGIAVLQNATITSNASIGNHVIILPGSVVSHDAVVGDYTCVAAGVCISGGVTIGSSCYLGTNSSIRGDISLGDGCLIGMGSAVLESVEPGTTVTGNPAKPLRAR